MRKKNIVSIPSPNDVNLVIYHSDCTDGFTARYAAEQLLGSRAEYYAAKHGTLPPNVCGLNVAIVDFSYDRETTTRLIADAKSLVVLDHHISALRQLDGIPNARFNMEKSGAMLSWEFFHPGIEPPKFVRYVQDRDLWKWELPYSKEFNAAFDMTEFDYDQFSRFEDDSVFDDAVKRGSYILAYSKTVVKKVCDKAARRKYQGMEVMVVNSSHWMSEIGNKLSHDCDFAVIWYFDHEDRKNKVSLRAFHDNVDVSEIAKRFGGGGHKKAAGFALLDGSHIEEIFDVE